MKKIFLIFIVLTQTISIFAQKDGFGFYFGYQLGKYSPGLGNINATTNLYNKLYDADFNYNDNVRGVTYGIKVVTHKFYQIDLQIVRRKSIVESNFINPDNGEIWKLGFKTRYNTFVFGNALHFHPFAVGIGMEIGRFKLYTKRLLESEYNSGDWNKNNETIYGDKLVLSKMLDITGGYFLYAEFMPKFFGIRVHYSVPQGSESYQKPEDLIFYEFKPANIGVSVLFNYFIGD